MKPLKGEIFKQINESYLISNMGRVFSLKNFKFLKPYPNLHGYMRVKIYSENKHKDIFVHIAVVHTFGDKNGKFPDCSRLSEKGLSIDHINRDKSNNSVQNLEIVSHQENCARWSAVEKPEHSLPY